MFMKEMQLRKNVHSVEFQQTSSIKQEEGELSHGLTEHVVGVAEGVDEEILQGLRDNFNGECSEVGMYLAMARVAHQRGLS